MDQPADYPVQWETHAVLKDGSTVELRPIKATDRDALELFHGRQSQESIYFRFFRYRPELSDKELDYFTQVDYQDRMAFVAVLGDELVAVARYERWKDASTAEVAFFVDDAHHGKGLATLMLEFLAAAARERELTGFTATVLAENYRMLAVFRSAGFEVSTRFADGHIEVELGIDVTEETSSAIADRHRLSTARSVARIVEPSSVAVIGASRQVGSVGHELVRNLAASVQAGGVEASKRIFPVNPAAEEIAGLPVYGSIAKATAGLSEADVDAIDLAVIAVRAELVEGIVLECVEAGVQGLLIVSSGYSELHAEGREKELRLVDLARDNGVRLIGPNAFGIINTNPDVNLGAVFHHIPVRAGSVSLASQSGPLGAAVLERVRAAGAGVSSFVGIGNRADVSVNDLLDYWSLDTQTDVVMLYVENFGNLQNFSAVARRTSEAKPVVTIRPSSPDLSELLRQAGVILVDEVSQLAEQALLAATQPQARGNRVVIISNASSLGRLATAACRRHGLEVVVPGSVADIARDDSMLIGDLDTVSLMPSSDPDEYERFMVAAAVSEEVDLILMALAPTAYLTASQLASLLDRVNRSIDKPMAATGLVDTDSLQVDRLPVFTFPEEAAQVLGRHAGYGQWRAARKSSSSDWQQPGEDPPPAIVEELLSENDESRHTLVSPHLPQLLEEFDLSVAPYALVRSEEELVAAAEDVGFPVVIKAGALVQRTIGESGGAAIDLHDSDDLIATYRRMSSQLGSAMDVTVVQRMVAPGSMARLELIQDPSVGSLISVAAGGSGFHHADAVARRFLPIDDVLAGELVDAIVDGPLLASIDPVGRDALMDLIHRLAAAAARTEHLAGVVLNPVLISGSDTVPVDVEMVFRRHRRDHLAGLRHI